MFPVNKDQAEAMFLIAVMALLCIIVWTPVARGQMLTVVPTVPYLPPAKYDYAFPGKVTVTRVTVDQLRRICKAADQYSLGCSGHNSNLTCDIYLVDDESIRAAGWTYELMYRHERAHCNGWTQAHEDKRSLGEATYPVLRYER